MQRQSKIEYMQTALMEVLLLYDKKYILVFFLYYFFVVSNIGQKISTFEF